MQAVPFHLPRLMKADFVGITEGERDALTLETLGIAGTCNSGGALNFKTDLVQWFAGKKIAIFADNDDKGRSHALKVAAMLKPIAESVKIIEFPSLPEKGDVTDFAQAGGTVDDIRALYSKAQEWTPEWTFAPVADLNEKYTRTLEQVIHASGGLQGFWSMPELAGIPTPFPRLTRCLGGGMRAGEVYVLGANQGAGKTSLALQFMLSALIRRYGVLMFSMEMGWKDVFQRLISIQARVDLLEFRNAKPSHLSAQAMREALAESNE